MVLRGGNGRKAISLPDAIARDLACDYTEITIAGEYLIYRAA